jgi:hypothetical protein
LNVGDDAFEGEVVAVMAVDAVQARGAARDVIGLLLDDELQTRLGRAGRRTLALMLGARQSRDYSFVSKSSWP